MAAGVAMLSGRERLKATTAVLQRARLADPLGDVWEAADVQWWWRRPRVTDDLATPVWFDGSGPVAAVGLTAWDHGWQGDAFVVPSTVEVDEVWSALTVAAQELCAPSLEVLARDDDEHLLTLLEATGFEAGDERSGITWMPAEQRPPVAAVPDGFRIVDRGARGDRPHPMIARNGGKVEARLRECSLYDPSLDLAVEDLDGNAAGYALFWLDRITGVGMLEPMRVEDEYQRRGLARALLTAGLDGLASGGARRLKVGFDGEAGRNLYLSAGFVPTATLRAFTKQP